MIVIDASIAIRWILPGDIDLKKIWHPSKTDRLIGPELLPLEARSAILKYVRRGDLTHEEASDFAERIDRIVPDLVPLAELIQDAWSLTLELDHSPYDCVYLALAQRHDTKLVTADKSLCNKLKGTPYQRYVLYGIDG
jgi:predicted nucleic acid-binding protein